MGYSPWGLKESDITAHHTQADFWETDKALSPATLGKSFLSQGQTGSHVPSVPTSGLSYPQEKAHPVCQVTTFAT